MRKRFAIATMLLLVGATAANASIISQYVPDADRVGEGRLSFLFWDVYDAALYAPQGTYEEGKPFALTLHYLTDADGKTIADLSIDNIRKQNFADEMKLAAWHTQMLEIFPNVQKGEQLTGIYKADGTSVFYKNNQIIGTISDPEFGRYFFNIWLAESTTEPTLRKQLLGLK